MDKPKSKFAGLFDQPAQAPEPDGQELPEAAEPVPPAGQTARPVGRPPGKRSNPAWKQFSLLLRRDTQRQAMMLLRSGEGGQDLSGLVQTLLEEWVRTTTEREP